MIWFTSDQHFGHENIIKYTQRPFRDVEHQTDSLLNGINSRVKPEDVLVFLGDVFMYKTQKQNQDVFSRIKCKNIHLITGNHDFPGLLPRGLSSIKPDWFLGVKDPQVPGDKTYMHLYHYPLLEWNGKYKSGPDMHPTWHLHGHSHRGQRHPDFGRLPVLNVSVENTGYAPVSYKQLKIYFKKNT